MSDTLDAGLINLDTLKLYKHEHLSPRDFYGVNSFEISDYSWVNTGEDFDAYFEKNKEKRDIDIGFKSEIKNWESKYVISLTSEINPNNIILNENFNRKSQKDKTLNKLYGGAKIATKFKLKEETLSLDIGGLYSSNLSEYLSNDFDADEDEDIFSYERSFDGSSLNHVAFGDFDRFDDEIPLTGRVKDGEKEAIEKALEDPKKPRKLAYDAEDDDLGDDDDEIIHEDEEEEEDFDEEDDDEFGELAEDGDIDAEEEEEEDFNAYDEDVEDSEGDLYYEDLGDEFWGEDIVIGGGEEDL